MFQTNDGDRPSRRRWVKRYDLSIKGHRRYLGVCVGNVTQILRAIDEGDSAAAQELLPAVYAELRKLAEQRLSREAAGHTLQATALVHEAYLRLVDGGDQEGVNWGGRAHFFAAAAEAMRRILIDHARAKGAVKRGGGIRKISLSFDPCEPAPPAELLELDEALQELHREDSEKSELIKLRFFAGLTMQQAADVMGISRATANRHWAYARAWLYARIQKYELNDESDETSGGQNPH